MYMRSARHIVGAAVIAAEGLYLTPSSAAAERTPEPAARERAELSIRLGSLVRAP